MEKQVRKFNVEFDFDWTCGVKISKLREDLDALERLGATEIEIESNDGWGYNYIEIKAFEYREETDEEYRDRIEREEYFAKKQKAAELKEFNRLKLLYGQ